MKSAFFAMTMLAVGAAIAPGPIPTAFAAEQAVAGASQPPHYELRYGYEHGGRWRARWVLVN